MVILVTGASKGIGYELCRALANKNHQVVALSRTEMPLKYSNIHFFQGDVTNDEFMENVVKKVELNFGYIDVLINNAGYLVNKPFEKITQEDLYQVFNVNYMAPFKLIQRYLPLLKKSHQAHIINISSMGGLSATQKFSGLSVYSSSKGALNILTECLAEELKPMNIYCNALALGAVQTEMLQSAFPGFEAPLSAQKMSEFIVWFIENGRVYFNGKILPVASTTP